MTNTTTKNTSTCSVEEAAEILKVHTTSVEKLMASGEIPAGRIGLSYVMRTSDVVRYAEKVSLTKRLGITQILPNQVGNG